MVHVYMIMPVGSDSRFSEKKGILKTLEAGLGVSLHFPGYTQSASQEGPSRLQGTLDELRRSHLVIADLSFERPSCYYELGLAQTMGKEVSLIAEKGTPIHQAIGRSKTMFYESLTEYRTLVATILRGARRDSRPEV